MRTDFKLPEPVEDTDFYMGEVHLYTVFIEVQVEGLEESYSEADVCYDAVNKFKNGDIDGNAEIVQREPVRNIELCWGTNDPFDRKEWLKTKLQELGINEEGRTLRPFERGRHPNETTLNDFGMDDEIIVSTVREVSYNVAKKEILDYIEHSNSEEVHISELAEELSIEFELIEEILRKEYN